MEEILKKLGANIKQFRKNRGMTQLEFEVLSGFGTADLSRIENGEVNITFTKLVQIAIVLGVELNELYSIKGDEK